MVIIMDGNHGFDTGLEISVDPGSLIPLFDDIPKQATAYSDCLTDIRNDIDTNVWEGTDGAALRNQFEGYLEKLKLGEAELVKLSELAKSLKEAIEKTESGLTTNINAGGGE